MTLLKHMFIVLPYGKYFYPLTPDEGEHIELYHVSQKFLRDFFDRDFLFSIIFSFLFSPLTR